MSFLQYVNPKNIPVYKDWDFEVLESEITIRSIDLKNIIMPYLENHNRYYQDIPKDWGRYIEFLRVSELYRVIDNLQY